MMVVSAAAVDTRAAADKSGRWLAARTCGGHTSLVVRAVPRKDGSLMRHRIRVIVTLSAPAAVLFLAMAKHPIAG